MDIHRRAPLASRRRHECRWNRRFCVRRREIYDEEDNRVLENPANTAALIEAFFDDQESLLNPPCYNFVALKEFLKPADLQHLTVSRPSLALLDDRREGSGGTESMRNWESDAYCRNPPEGVDVERNVFDEKGLFRKLKENVG
jgi:hypothetical protein